MRSDRSSPPSPAVARPAWSYQYRHAMYNYSAELPFETRFDKELSTGWMQRNWTLALVFSLLYVAAIFAGRRLMTHRAPFHLRPALFCWNALLAVFSVLGAIRMSPEFFFTVRTYGFHHSVCIADYTQLKVTGFWATAFTYSKAVELFDTAFIVLRKRPLIFLHWYHHITVMILTWWGYKDHTAPARWFIWMNYCIHAFMYSYYALRVPFSRCPKWISMLLTTAQTAQMFMGCIIAAEVLRSKWRHEYCQQTDNHLILTCVIYTSYLVLFGQFFYNTYLAKRSSKDRDDFRLDAKSFGEKPAQNGVASKKID